eukprot:TRINITY_DN543_c0_g1_i2.p1 TRINITY_DN543_c0_g1~~TRINITY_DN543_c0_g1_i2.p1  ORF type:complete len:213 (-),score=2.19 TRINITY_DN543_c0_g1_i2:93-731(-)
MAALKLFLLSLAILSFSSPSEAAYRSYRSYRSYYSYYYYYYYGYGSSGPAPIPYCGNPTTIALNENDTCYTRVPGIKVDSRIDYNALSGNASWVIENYLKLVFANKTVLPEFFASCGNIIELAACKKHFIDCTYPDQSPCTAACWQMKMCREGVFNHSGIDIGEVTNFKFEDCGAYATCTGKAFCCWGAAPGRGWAWLGLLVLGALWNGRLI